MTVGNSLHEGHDGPNECIRTVPEFLSPNRHCGFQVTESQIDIDHEFVLSLPLAFTELLWHSQGWLGKLKLSRNMHPHSGDGCGGQRVYEYVQGVDVRIEAY